MLVQHNCQRSLKLPSGGLEPRSTIGSNCDVKEGRGGSSGRRAGSIEHEDVNLADTFSRFAEQSRCTIGGSLLVI